jgi:hypothetical protein
MFVCFVHLCILSIVLRHSRRYSRFIKCLQFRDCGLLLLLSSGFLERRHTRGRYHCQAAGEGALSWEEAPRAHFHNIGLEERLGNPVIALLDNSRTHYWGITRLDSKAIPRLHTSASRLPSIPPRVEEHIIGSIDRIRKSPVTLRGCIQRSRLLFSVDHWMIDAAAYKASNTRLPVETKP